MQMSSSVKRLALVFTVLLFCGCAARGPMTDSEFLGYCHSADNRRGGCDSVALCDSYLHVVGAPQTDLQPCMAGCEEVRLKLAAANRSSACAGVLRNANDWCNRYCRTLFPD